MAIKGTERVEQAPKSRKKKVGLFEAKVIAINPTMEEFKTILNIDLKDESATEYLDENKNMLIIDIWLEEVKSKDFFKLTYFLRDEPLVKRDGTKNKYINGIGKTTYATSLDTLPSWFVKGECRQARHGEEELYTFLRTWLGGLNFNSEGADLTLNWNNLMKGNTSEIKNLIGTNITRNILALATVNTDMKDGKTVEYQRVYGRAFLPAFTMSQFNNAKFWENTDTKIADLQKRKEDPNQSSSLRPFERFVLSLYGEYGCKDFFVLEPIRDYNPEENIVASDSVLVQDDPTF